MKIKKYVIEKKECLLKERESDQGKYDVVYNGDNIGYIFSEKITKTGGRKWDWKCKSSKGVEHGSYSTSREAIINLIKGDPLPSKIKKDEPEKVEIIEGE